MKNAAYTLIGVLCLSGFLVVGIPLALISDVRGAYRMCRNVGKYTIELVTGSV